MTANRGGNWGRWYQSLTAPGNLTPDQIITAAYLCDESYHSGSPVDDLSYLVSRQGGITYVAFRGTSNIDNARRDIRVFPPAFTPSGRLGHRGVLAGYRKLREAVLCDIHKDDPVIVTGHSLGGGLALPFAELLDCPVVTFGALKVYMRGMAPVLKHCRVVNDDDPVPLVPGICFNHDCEPYLRNVDRDDELIEVKDHSMRLYIDRTERALRL